MAVRGGALLGLLAVVLAACGDDEAPVPIPEGAVHYRVDGSAAVAEVSERFLSVAVDTAQVVGGTFWSPSGEEEIGRGKTRVPAYDFDRPKLRGLAAALAPAYLRIGGSDADFTFYDLSDDPVETAPAPYEWVLTRALWDRVNRFATDLDYRVLFTLNAGPGPRDEEGRWTTEQARQLIEYTVCRGFPVDVWELGNEPGVFPVLHGVSITGAELAADYGRLRRLLDEIDPEARLAGPAVAYWPVVGEILAPVLDDFLAGGGGALDIITWHYYPQQSRRCPAATRRAGSGVLLQPDALDEAIRMAELVEAPRAQYAPGAEVWLGETGNAQCGGEPGLSERYEAGFWWLDQLGLLARRGHRVVIRQTLSGSNYGMIDDETLDPNPDYFNSLLWNRFMGTRVLAVEAVGADASASVRVYAHCAPGGGGRIGVLVLNLDAARKADVVVEGPGVSGVRWMAVTAEGLDARRITVNGASAAVDDAGRWVMPAARSLRRPARGALLSLDPLTYGFAELETDAAACAGE